MPFSSKEKPDASSKRRTVFSHLNPSLNTDVIHNEFFKFLFLTQ